MRGALGGWVPNAVPFESFSLHGGKFLTYGFRSHPPLPPPLAPPAPRIFRRDRELKLREKREFMLRTLTPAASSFFFREIYKVFCKDRIQLRKNIAQTLRWFIYVKRVDYVKQIFPHLQERKLRIPELRNSLQIEITKENKCSHCTSSRS